MREKREEEGEREMGISLRYGKLSSIHHQSMIVSQEERQNQREGISQKVRHFEREKESKL